LWVVLWHGRGFAALGSQRLQVLCRYEVWDFLLFELPKAFCPVEAGKYRRPECFDIFCRTVSPSSNATRIQDKISGLAVQSSDIGDVTPSN
jgi:hypothetical protein